MEKTEKKKKKKDKKDKHHKDEANEKEKIVVSTPIITKSITIPAELKPNNGDDMDIE